ncbi:putative ORFan [Tupanvirus deep ocean]|uniref:ORFan n=2 Tax=Tupanvirus TaxID=2094720 RepID=A0AC62A7G5_9VIRU|nr:putative ORFan [Tupanvirus deep ocean]QKU33719.1 putative ORFan [Tupanvirus deep ocean]
MENLNNYLNRFQSLSTYFNKPLTYDNIGTTETSNLLVFQLVLDMCQNQILQQQVLAKLIEYTSHRVHLSEIQLKPKYFYQIIETYQNFVTKYLKNSNEITKFLTGYVVDFSLFQNTINHNFCYIWVVKIFLDADGSLKKVCEENKINNYEIIIMRSIVGAETIKQYGIDGFLALLIMYINEDHMENVVPVDSLVTICKKNLANKFNMLRNDIVYYISGNTQCTEIDYYELAIRFEPKKILDKWINLFIELTSNLPDSVIEDSIKYMNQSIQMIFFKKINDVDDTTVIHYKSNFDDVINDMQKQFNVRELSIIESILKINTIDKWIDVLKELILLNDDDIMRIFIQIQPKFANVFFGIDVNLKRLLKFTVLTRKDFVLIKGKLYDKHMEIHNIGSVTLTTITWKYDKDLNCIGYDILENDNNNRTRIKCFDVNNNLISDSLF